MAYMVFISTSMVSMSLHFCGGQMAGIGLFDSEYSVDSCCAEKVSTCEKESKKDCCEDEYIDLEWDVDMAIHTDGSDQAQLKITAIIPAFYSLIINSPQAISSPQTYIPPLLQVDRTILFQQFLC